MSKFQGKFLTTRVSSALTICNSLLCVSPEKDSYVGVLIELATPFSLAYRFLAYSLSYFSSDSFMYAFFRGFYFIVCQAQK